MNDSDNLYFSALSENSDFEPFFEDDNKPFGSRWPGGNVIRAEEHNRYGKNVK